MRRWVVLFFAAATGYLALTQEMLWMRLVGYSSGGDPGVFARILGFFLIGVAGGALWAERFFDHKPRGGIAARPAIPPIALVGMMLLGSAVFYDLSIAGVARIFYFSGIVGAIFIYFTVTMVALLSGGIFTVLCHEAATPGRNVETTVSHVYLANIIGSTLGPLLSGFVLMQILSIDRLIGYVTAGVLLLGVLAILVALSHGPIPASMKRGAIALASLGVACLLLQRPLYHNLLYAFHSDWSDEPFKYLLENRSGIIAVTKGDTPALPDVLYGGGVYDGRYTTDPVEDTNGIRRAYLLAAIHPDPRDVLVVGLATGSAVRVAADDPAVQNVTAVEINPGYLQLLEHYPEHASILSDPKVHIAIDDGRRWLLRHPQAKFDVLYQNTIYHYRNEATNLLSTDFFDLCKQHLKPGGVVFVNTTGSQDVSHTVARCFRRVVRYQNSVIATDSDEPFHLTPEQIAARLQSFSYGGQSDFASIDPDRQKRLTSALTEMAHTPFIEAGDELRADPHLRLITDDNVLPEFKRQWHADSDGQKHLQDQSCFDFNRSWFRFFRRR